MKITLCDFRRPGFKSLWGLSFQKLGPITSSHWISNFFCKENRLDYVITKAPCSSEGLNISQIKDKYHEDNVLKIIYSLFLFFFFFEAC